MFFVKKDISNIDASNLLDVLLVRPDKLLLYFDLLSEYYELLVSCWIAQLTVHHFENGLELIVHLHLLYICVDYSEVNVLWELFNCFLDVNGHDLIPLLLDFVSILSLVLHLLYPFFDFLEPSLLLQPCHYSPIAFSHTRLFLSGT